jgi:hypothetical protein
MSKELIKKKRNESIADYAEYTLVSMFIKNIWLLAFIVQASIVVNI